MGGGHVERGQQRPERPERRKRRGRSRSRHRAESTSDEPTDSTRREAVRRSAEAPGSFSFSTTALVIAVTGLVGLGLVARWVSDTGQTGSARPAATAPASGGDAVGTAPPGQEQPSGQPGGTPGTPTRTIGARGEIRRELVVVPDSDCHQFVQTRQEFPDMTISVANSCQ